MQNDTSHRMSPEEWRELAMLAARVRIHYEGDLLAAQSNGIEEAVPELVDGCVRFYRVELEARGMVESFGEAA